MAYIVFQSPIGYHLYDREKNNVVSLTQKEFDILSSDGKSDFCEEGKEVLARFNSKGYCLPSTLERIEHPLGRIMDAYLDQKISELVLQLTQSCNLRCSYCVYSGNYYNRTHSSNHMTADVAFRAIDFLMSHSSAEEKTNVGFYGGEPFLKFDLMKQVVSYIEEKYPDRSCGYNLTTNMTLLNDEIIDFILDKGISLTMSIDGPKEVQDRFRRFDNGDGSFTRIMQNVKKLKLRDATFFSRCSTNTVISPDQDYEAIYNFLEKDEFIGPLRSLTSTISDQGIKIEMPYRADFYSIQNRELFKVLLFMLEMIDRSKISMLFLRYKDDLLKTFSLLKLDGLQNTLEGHPSGPCLPGVRRLFVDIQGNFYPCEKIPEQKNFQIGNIFSGFDRQQISKILNVGKYTEKECIACWAFMQCSACGVTMIEETKFSRTKRLSKCKDIWNSAVSKMRDIELLKYYGYDFETIRDQ